MTNDARHQTARATRARLRPGVGQERGSVLVEAAFVLPFLLLLIFGMLEYGMWFRDSAALQNATRAGAREGSTQGNNADADWYILQAVKRGTADMPQGSVEQIVIYNANAPTSTDPNATAPPAACTATGSSGVATTSDGIGACNVYVAGDLDVDLPTFESPASSTYVRSRSWPAEHRNISTSTDPSLARSDGTPGPDYVGIWVKTTHHWITGLFGSTAAITDTTVFKIEPRE